mmetsp:Transcript_27804/g.86556  ORF Transcript_27804/g.86556 Transcript_27804/m.86556 type:complete len:279 (-) Transcript_27804:299-1135(-)
MRALGELEDLSDAQVASLREPRAAQGVHLPPEHLGVPGLPVEKEPGALRRPPANLLVDGAEHLVQRAAQHDGAADASALEGRVGDLVAHDQLVVLARSVVLQACERVRVAPVDVLAGAVLRPVQAVGRAKEAHEVGAVFAVRGHLPAELRVLLVLVQENAEVRPQVELGNVHPLATLPMDPICAFGSTRNAMLFHVVEHDEAVPIDDDRRRMAEAEAVQLPPLHHDLIVNRPLHLPHNANAAGDEVAEGEGLRAREPAQALFALWRRLLDGRKHYARL